MPRSLPISNKLRLLLVALFFVTPLFFAGLRAGAQKGRGTPAGTAGAASFAPQSQKKNLTRLNTSETPEGSSITIISDSALNDYSAYRSGDRFYVLIPQADASRVANGLRGRGFADVRAQKRGDDVLLSFKLLAGATARVSQKFNRLEIIVTVPALVAANSQSNAGNTGNNGNPANTGNAGNASNRTQPSNNTGTGTQSTGGNSGNSSSGTRTQTGTGTAPFNNSGANTTGTTGTSGNTGNAGNSGTNPIGPNQQNNAGQQSNNSGTSSANPNFNNQSAGIPTGPNGQGIQPGTEGFPPLAGASPLASQPVPLPSDQVAQLPNAPSNPATSTNAPPLTTSNAPASSEGSSFGAALKQNWILLLIALAVAGLIAWVVLARSRAERSPVEERIESLRESKTAAIKATPASARVRAAPVASPVAKVKAEPLAEKPVDAAATESGTALSESLPAAAVIAPVVAAGMASAATGEEEETASEAKELEPVVPVMTEPVAAEAASAEVANLLAGHHYDEAVINTQHSNVRQMVAAELLAALSGRNPVRHERAREAFVKHGYFDDATRTLRTAENPAERASAARSLGLVRDQSATPHLAAALEDSSPEVRRAAVESLAEVRDPSAVASLEALRDREKDRKIPKALIQHAIEASVVGRLAEPKEPVKSPYATTPLTEAHAQETTPLPEDFVPLPPLEELPEIVAEVPPDEAAATAEAVEAAAPEVVEAPAPEVVEAAEPEAIEAAAPEVVETPSPEVEAFVPEAVETAAPEAFEAAEPEALEASPLETPQAEAGALETEAVIAPVLAEEVAQPFVAEEAATPLEAATPQVVHEEAAAPLAFEQPAVEEAAPVEQVEPVQAAEPAVIEEEAAQPQLEEAAQPLVEAAPPAQVEEAVAPVPEETPAPVATAEPVIEFNDGTASDWVDVDVNAPEAAKQEAAPFVLEPIAPAEAAVTPEAEAFTSQASTETIEPLVESAPETALPPVMPVVAEVAATPAAPAEERGLDVAGESAKELEAVGEDPSNVPTVVLRRLASEDASERAAAVTELGRIGGEDSFREISASFDDPSPEVRSAAARSLYNLNPDRAASFTRALREAPPERRRHIGAALASSGLATEAIGHLMGESREKTYDAFSLLFLMSKAGEVQPLMRAVEEHPNNEVRLAVVKLLALSGQQEILPAFRRLAVRGSLPTEVRSAVMEAIYQISSQAPGASA